jgi:alpha-glucosidase
MQPLVEFTDQKPVGPLVLMLNLPSLATAEDCSGSLYEDDGHSFAYERGEILSIHYSCELSGNFVTVISKMEKNAFTPWWKGAEIQMCGVATTPKEVRIDSDLNTGWRYDAEKKCITIALPDALRNWTVRVGL